MRTRMLAGEHFSFDQMTDGLYCLVAPACDYKKFDDILDELDQALPGTGTVQEKIAEFRKKLAIPPENLLSVIKTSTQVFHDKMCIRDRRQKGGGGDYRARRRGGL